MVVVVSLLSTILEASDLCTVLQQTPEDAATSAHAVQALEALTSNCNCCNTAAADVRSDMYLQQSWTLGMRPPAHCTATSMQKVYIRGKFLVNAYLCCCMQLVPPVVVL